jgi:hypothetical protein
MDTRRQEMCELALQNRQYTKNIMRSQDLEFSSLCAVIAACRGIRLSDETISYTNNLIKKSKFLGSEFLPGSRIALATTMHMDPDPDTVIERVIKIDKLLLSKMLPSHHLSLTAMVMGEMLPPEDDENAAEQVNQIYKYLRGLFPFLISDNDCNAAALAYISGVDMEVFGRRMEDGLGQLRKHALSRKVLIPLAQLFALSNRTTDEKVDEFREVLDALEDKNIPVGTEDYDFAAIGALALCKRDDSYAQNIKDMCDYLSDTATTNALMRKVRNRRRVLYAMFMETACLIDETEDYAMMRRMMTLLRSAQLATLVNDVTSFLGGIN